MTGLEILRQPGNGMPFTILKKFVFYCPNQVTVEMQPFQMNYLLSKMQAMVLILLFMHQVGVHGLFQAIRIHLH